MPDEAVRVIFMINSKNTPKEDQSNNKVEVLIPGLHYEIQEATYTLDYDELSRDIEHDLAGGGISGALRDPTISDWYWVDELHMTGSLPVNIAASIGGRTALENTGVKTNTNNPVDEPSTSVTRSPVIQGTIERPDFHDDPLNEVYHINGHVDNPMKVYYNKSREDSLTRSFRYHTSHSVRTGTDSEGNPTYSNCSFCTSHYSTGTTAGKFAPGEDRLTIRALIYNGRQKMPHVAARDFLKEIEDNTTDSLTKKIYWESEEYPMTVQRWMKHVELVEKPKAPSEGSSEAGEVEEADDYVAEMEEKKTWEPVPGQYERIFTQQNTAEIKWGVKTSMDKAYASDRKNAKNSKRDKQSYEKVPFATDKELQSYKYPFKSGYYFNPAGEYTVTIHTEIYKDKQEETEEHKELVDKIIESFRYSSTLKYLDSDRNQENLLLKIDDASGDETTLTFIIDPDNAIKKYTYGGMKDGTYHTLAWVEDADLSAVTRVSGMKMAGIKDETPLDHIPITVKGSMYDDLNN